MQIREIKEADNKIVELIIKQSLESFGLNLPGTAYYDPQLGHLTAFYQQTPNAMYWVLVNENDVAVGGVGIAPFGNNPDICELQKLYISPEAQGLGYSRKLMNIALEFAKKHYTYCYLETMNKLEIANLLYSKLGFQQLDKPLNGSEHGTMDTWYIKKLM